MANKYKVSISYLKFIFDDRSEALDFAETAFNKIEEDNRSVDITIVRSKDDDQEGEGDE